MCSALRQWHQRCDVVQCNTVVASALWCYAVQHCGGVSVVVLLKWIGAIGLPPGTAPAVAE